MSKKLIVTEEEMNRHLKFAALINGAAIEDIIIHKGVAVLHVSDEDIKSFKYTGLNNVDYVRMALATNGKPFNSTKEIK